MNFLDGKVGAAGDGTTTVTLGNGPITLPAYDARLAVGDAVKIGVRPEDFMLADGNSGRVFNGRIVLVEPLGGETMAHVALDGSGVVVVKLSGETVVAQGAPIALSVDPARCHLFDRDGIAVRAEG
jgi:multiple sugar transport system ATP-binding protein